MTLYREYLPGNFEPILHTPYGIARWLERMQNSQYLTVTVTVESRLIRYEVRSKASGRLVNNYLLA